MPKMLQISGWFESVFANAMFNLWRLITNLRQIFSHIQTVMSKILLQIFHYDQQYEGLTFCETSDVSHVRAFMSPTYIMVVLRTKCDARGLPDIHIRNKNGAIYKMTSALFRYLTKNTTSPKSKAKLANLRN